MKKKSWIAVIAITCSLFINICGCAKQEKELNSTVLLIKIDTRTGKERAAFIFKVEDFQQILIIRHALLGHFEVKGILNEENRKTLYNFTNLNIGHKIKILLDGNMKTKERILQPLNFIPFGYYDSKNRAVAVARKLTNNPKYEDWREKEIKEQVRKDREKLK